MPGEMKITIEGLEKLARKLGNPRIKANCLTAMKKATMLIHHQVAAYPPVPPFSRYVRTGMLGRGWGTKSWTESNDVKGEVRNNVEYAPLVQGPEQKLFHKTTGWKRLDATAETQMPEIAGFFDDAIGKAVKDLGD